jgi:hypothetical protein
MTLDNNCKLENVTVADEWYCCANVMASKLTKGKTYRIEYLVVKFSLTSPKA